MWAVLMSVQQITDIDNSFINVPFNDSIRGHVMFESFYISRLVYLSPLGFRLYFHNMSFRFGWIEIVDF